MVVKGLDLPMATPSLIPQHLLPHLLQEWIPASLSKHAGGKVPGQRLQPQNKPRSNISNGERPQTQTRLNADSSMQAGQKPEDLGGGKCALVEGQALGH